MQHMKPSTGAVCGVGDWLCAQHASMGPGCGRGGHDVSHMDCVQLERTLDFEDALGSPQVDVGTPVTI